MDALMSMAGGMDMSSSGVWFGTNSSLARSFWYIIAGCVGFMLLIRVASRIEYWSRLRASRARSTQYPTKPHNAIWQAFATLTAIAREISHPQFYFNNKMLSWMSPPNLGKILVILIYWSLIAGMMTRGAIVNDPYYYERIGFRSAWIGITQVPLVYLLASKSSIIGYLIGSSHERLNWLHRWVSRTLLITITVHGTFFFAEWVRADFVALELSMMTMVKYGIGCWAILVWTTFTSLSPLRRIAYEVFVIQHLAAAAVFLWLLYLHAPTYARFYVWFAVIALVSDFAVRIGLLLFKNIRFTRNGKGLSRLIGHRAQLEANAGGITVLTVHDPKISWRPGQHLYLQIPKLAPFQSHPYTIATVYRKLNDQHAGNDIQLAIRTHSGFSKKLHQYAHKNTGSSVTAFLTGPFGCPPSWEAFETICLVSASTGASFTLPILESILHSSGTSCVTKINFLFAVRDKRHIDFYVDRLAAAVSAAKESGIRLTVEIAITGDGYQALTPHTHSASSSISDQVSISCGNDKPDFDISARRPGEISPDGIVYSYGRPNIADFIRFPVEETGGETAVAVCGGKSLVGSVRNFVAALSDERAVHKGTGAQGIFLHVEEYCF